MHWLGMRGDQQLTATPTKSACLEMFRGVDHGVDEAKILVRFGRLIRPLEYTSVLLFYPVDGHAALVDGHAALVHLALKLRLRVIRTAWNDEETIERAPLSAGDLPIRNSK